MTRFILNATVLISKIHFRLNFLKKLKFLILPYRVYLGENEALSYNFFIAYNLYVFNSSWLQYFGLDFDINWSRLI